MKTLLWIISATGRRANGIDQMIPSSCAPGSSKAWCCAGDGTCSFNSSLMTAVLSRCMGEALDGQRWAVSRERDRGVRGTRGAEIKRALGLCCQRRWFNWLCQAQSSLLQWRRGVPAKSSGLPGSASGLIAWLRDTNRSKQAFLGGVSRSRQSKEGVCQGRRLHFSQELC